MTPETISSEHIHKQRTANNIQKELVAQNVIENDAQSLILMNGI